MNRQDQTNPATLHRVGNALLASALALALAGSAWGLDVADVITAEWTPEGKKLAVERARTWPVKDEMVRVPAGWFLMGSDRKVHRNTYPAELPQRRVYLDAFDMDRYEVSALQY